MPLPIDINGLLNNEIYESERIEYKEGWNPEKILRTINAFANDINDWGGGYILIGVKAVDGVPERPVVGIPPSEVDNIQRKLVELGNMMVPAYHPISSPEIVDGKCVLVLWVPGGENRPYSIPVTLGEKAVRGYFVRRHASSVRISAQEESQLLLKGAKVPFDDRVNHQATLADLDLGLIREYLQACRSSLFSKSTKMDFEELCMHMQLARGPREALRPLNVALLMFSEEPRNLIPCAQIDLVFRSPNGGRSFQEHIFAGPIHKQIKEALAAINLVVGREYVLKNPEEPEATRWTAYPKAALEEAIVNAVYHKSYEVRQPIEINVYHNMIEILSYPGPMPPITAKVLSSHERIVSRYYRNRRIGDFLKELKLTEGRATGLDLIRTAMIEAGAPEPEFETDEGATYFLTRLHKVIKYADMPQRATNTYAIGTEDTSGNYMAEPPGAYYGARLSHPSERLEIETARGRISQNEKAQVKRVFYGLEVAENKADQKQSAETLPAAKYRVTLISERALDVLTAAFKPKTKAELLTAIGLGVYNKNFSTHVVPLITMGYLELTLPDKPTSPKQKYVLSDAGVRFLQGKTD